MRICAVIPALNEERQLFEVIQSVMSFGVIPIVVDDGSIDNTYNIALESGAKVLRHSNRQGKGSAIRDGLNFALKDNYDLIFTLDGDGQHDPKEIKSFLDALEDNSIVVGNRLVNARNMPFWRKVSNKINSFAISLLCGQSIGDAQCGYRLFPKRAINSINIEASGYEIELEMTVKLARQGFKIISVPIESIYGTERSDIRPIRDSWRVFKFFLYMLRV